MVVLVAMLVQLIERIATVDDIVVQSVEVVLGPIKQSRVPVLVI